MSAVIAVARGVLYVVVGLLWILVCGALVLAVLAGLILFAGWVFPSIVSAIAAVSPTLVTVLFVALLTVALAGFTAFVYGFGRDICEHLGW